MRCRPLILALLICSCQSAQGDAPAEDLLELNRRLVDLLAWGAPDAEVLALLAAREPVFSAQVRDAPDAALAAALAPEVIDRLVRELPAAEGLLEAHRGLKGKVRVIISDDHELHEVETLHLLRVGDGPSVRLRFAGEAPELQSGSVIEVEGVLSAARSELATRGVREQSAAFTSACTVTGDQPAAVLFVTAPGVPVTVSQATVDTAFFAATAPSLETLWPELSFGALTLSGASYGPYMLDRAYGCDENEALETAAIAAADADVDFSQVRRIFIVFPRPAGGCNYGGRGEFGCGNEVTTGDGTFVASTSWLINEVMTPRDWAVAVIAHEAGHNFVLSHARSLGFPGEPIGAPGVQGTITEYGDPYDAVGGNNKPTFFDAPHEARLGWLSYTTVEAAGTYSVAAYETSGAGPRALKVRRGPGVEEWLWLELRRPLGAYDSLMDPRMFAGPLVHWSTTAGSGNSYLLDFVPATTTDLWDAPLALGSYWSDPYTGLNLGVSSDGATMSVSVSYGPPVCGFQPPSVSVDPAGLTVANGENASFVVTVTNDDDPACPAGTFALSAPAQPPLTQSLVPASVTLGPGASAQATLTVGVPQAFESQTASVTASATKLGVSGSGSQSFAVASSCSLSAPSVALTPDTMSIGAGDAALFTVTVTNTSSPGCGAQAFALSAPAPAGWTWSFQPGSLTVAPGASATAALTAFVPASEPQGTLATVQVSATAGGLAGSGAAEVTVTELCVHTAPAVSLDPSSQGTRIGEPTDYVFTVTNTSTPTCVPETFTATTSGSAVLQRVVTPSSSWLPPGATGVFVVSVTPQSTATINGGYSLVATARGVVHLKSDFATAVVLAPCPGGPDPEVPPALTLTPAASSVTAGTTGTTTLTLVNGDYACSSAVFYYAATPPAGWTATLSPAAHIAPPGATRTATVSITPPASTPPGTYTVTLAATSSDGHHATIDAAVTVTPPCVRAAPSVTLAPAVATVEASFATALTLSVTNNDSAGCAASSFALSSAPAGWPAAWSAGPLVLAPGATGAATLTLTPPAATPPASYTVTAAATAAASAGSGSASLTVTPPVLRVSASVPGTSFPRNTNVTFTSISTIGANRAPGASVTFTLVQPNGAPKTWTVSADANGVAVKTDKVTLKGLYRLTARSIHQGQTAYSPEVTFTVN